MMMTFHIRNELNKISVTGVLWLLVVSRWLVRARERYTTSHHLSVMSDIFLTYGRPTDPQPGPEPRSERELGLRVQYRSTGLILTREIASIPLLGSRSVTPSWNTVKWKVRSDSVRPSQPSEQIYYWESALWHCPARPIWFLKQIRDKWSQVGQFHNNKVRIIH